MRFATISWNGADAWGFIDGNEVVIASCAPGFAWPTLKDAIAADALGHVAVAAAGAPRVALADAVWRTLIPAPGKILCIGINYATHREETGRPVTPYPMVFVRFPDSQTGHLAPIMRPPESARLDYEGELAVVIGRGGFRIKAGDAFDHVAGYSCYNDGSVRDWQRHTIQFTPGKNFPETGAFGPWLVTPDEFGPIGTQRIQTRLNGEVMQDATLADMICPIAELIEYVSTFTPLSPGDVIVSGTPGGVGDKREPPLYMKPGDLVEVEIDGVGTLVNTIADAA